MGWVVNVTCRPLHPRESNTIPILLVYGGWVGFKAVLGGCGKHRPRQDSISGPSSLLRVVIPTELSWNSISQMIQLLKWGTHRRTAQGVLSLSPRKVGQRAKWGFRRNLIEDSALLRSYARYVSCSWTFRDRHAVSRWPWTTNIPCVTSQKSEDQDQKVELNFWNCHNSQHAYSSKGTWKECFISRRKFPFPVSSVYTIQSDRHSLSSSEVRQRRG